MKGQEHWIDDGRAVETGNSQTIRGLRWLEVEILDGVDKGKKKLIPDRTETRAVERDALEVINEIARNFLPPLDLEAAGAKHSDTELMEIARQLDVIAQKAAATSEYLETRAMPNDHEAALQASQDRLRRVRKAMGYTYP